MKNNYSSVIRGAVFSALACLGIMACSSSGDLDRTRNDVEAHCCTAADPDPCCAPLSATTTPTTVETKQSTMCAQPRPRCTVDAGPAPVTPFTCNQPTPTSPPPPTPPAPPLNKPQGACQFYGGIIGGGGCSAADATLLGGYNQTCLNVTNGGGRAPDGAFCDSITGYRRWADEMRYCLQRETSGSIGNYCLDNGANPSCHEIVQMVSDGHATCNAQTNFCAVMSNPSSAWCFGNALGNAWGAIGVGTRPGGPLAPIGPDGMVVAIASCGLSAPGVQDSLCEGFRKSCIEKAGDNLVAVALCNLSCPDL